MCGPGVPVMGRWQAIDGCDGDVEGDSKGDSGRYSGGRNIDGVSDADGER